MEITPEQQSEMAHRPLDAIVYGILHHSVAPKGLDITQIAQMEKTSIGAITVAYHAYVRKRDGVWVIQEGRTIDDVPAAAYGLNEPSYDICIAGNYQPGVPDVPTDILEEESLTLAIMRFRLAKQKCPNLKYLIGHRDVAAIMVKRGLAPEAYSTDCPGDLLYARMHDLRVATGLSLPPELAP